MGGNARTVVTAAMVASLGLTALAATARADESLGEMAGNVQQLVEPAQRTELRLDASAVTSFPNRGSRFEVTLEIAPRQDYWYSVGVGSTSTITTSEVVHAGTDGNQVTTTTSTTDSSVSISARIFKRLGPVVISGGLLDDRGAIAIELRGWKDRVRFEAVSQGAGAWQVTGRPSVRLGGSLQWQWVYVQGGAQDLLDGSLRAAYVGLGIRWKDGDLRELLPWVAAH